MELQACKPTYKCEDLTRTRRNFDKLAKATQWRKDVLSPSIVSNSLPPNGPARLHCPWNVRLGCHFLLQKQG